MSDANGNATTYLTDGFDRPWRTTYPDGSFEEVTLDAGSRARFVRVRDGKLIGIDWDALGRRVQVNRPGGETIQAFGYDDLGRMTMAADSAGVRFGYDYDALGRLVTERAENGTPGGTMGYEYDLAGRRTVIRLS